MAEAIVYYQPVLSFIAISVHTVHIQSPQFIFYASRIPHLSYALNRASKVPCPI